MLPIHYDSTGFYVRVNKGTKYTNTAVLDLSNCLTYIGCQPDGSTTTNHLRGMMEMLAVSDSKVTDSIIDNMVDHGGRIIVRSRYDALGRSSKREIIVGANTINTTQYQYKELANGNTTPRIESETYSLNNTHMDYTYDNAN